MSLRLLAARDLSRGRSRDNVSASASFSASCLLLLRRRVFVLSQWQQSALLCGWQRQEGVRYVLQQRGREGAGRTRGVQIPETDLK
eukprot:3082857-Rhodomonas_salina.1